MIVLFNLVTLYRVTQKPEDMRNHPIIKREEKKRVVTPIFSFFVSLLFYFSFLKTLVI